MPSNLRPLGALLAAVALWALGLLLLSFAGLGGRVGPHPANPALMPPIPVVTLETAGPRLGPASDYLEAGNRPLLSAERRPPAVMAEAGGDNEAPLEANLTSVLLTPGLKLAILQGKEDGISRRVRLGEVLDGTAWRLVSLEPRRAVFEGPQGRRELELRVFDGTGGLPPTPQVATMPALPANEVKPANVPVAATPPPAPVPAPATAAADPAAPMTPEQQVEAIRRRIEARRAMRAAEAGQERPPPGTPQQQVQ